VVSVLALSAAAAVQAQNFPNRPLRIIVPYAPGGGADVVARQVSEAASARLGQPVIIENRPGGNTFIGMNACAKAPADGYTLCLVNGDALSFGPYVFSKIPYDPVKDLVAITKVATSPNGVFISGQLPFNTLSEVLAYGKANPGKLNFGSFGAGSAAHLYVEWLRRQRGVDMTHVAYKGAAPVVQALITNEVQITYTAYALVQQHVKTGRIKAVGIDEATRSPLLPEVPTLKEQNASTGIELYLGLYAPAGMPPALVERLNGVFTAALRDAKLQSNMSALLFTPAPTPAQQLEKMRQVEAEFARKFTQAIGMKPTDLPE
jgi:tripartite-type tricarboxylate transporter receptor subunit TctC